jgi:hypothetical protein
VTMRLAWFAYLDDNICAFAATFRSG